MSEYAAPVRDMMFVLTEVAGLAEVAKLPGREDASGELVAEVLDQAARFAGEVLSPLNRSGDVEGSQLVDGGVRTPSGFVEAYRQFVDSGWGSLQFPADLGGQDLPRVVAAPVMEMWKSANLAFSLCPLLTTGAIEALMLRGSDAQKALYLPRMISGEWTGTMNLTEPQAGSDLALVKSRASRDGDRFRIFGQKIFITWGDHDLADNIVHLVLARIDGAPAGVRGISLFLVPKRLVNADGSLGERNDARCISLEHKLGIHASPTAVMQYGEGEGAIGWLVGEENKGLETMFIMMNAARFAVGLEGLAVAERAYQRARDYARDRVQSRDVAGSAGPVAIIQHPDVRRMLMEMRSKVEAMRALAYVVAAAHDRAHDHPDAAERDSAQSFVDLMIPVVKGWSTETGTEVASIGVQVHGGMGYIEETGAAQHLRDARITTIYEGTTGIQANDLLGRKILRDGGATLRVVLARMRATAGELSACDSTRADARAVLRAIGARLSAGIDALEAGASWMIATAATDIRGAYAGAVPLLRLMGIVCGGWQLGRSAQAALRLLEAGDGDAGFMQAKLATARYFADHVLTQAGGLRDEICEGGASVLAMDEAQF
jgi:alkylation response protein AidB-like acyl-CoA dehydrogenase